MPRHGADGLSGAGFGVGVGIGLGIGFGAGRGIGLGTSGAGFGCVPLPGDAGSWDGSPGMHSLVPMRRLYGLQMWLTRMSRPTGIS